MHDVSLILNGMARARWDSGKWRVTTSELAGKVLGVGGDLSGWWSR